MRLFGIRASSAMLGLGLLGATLGILGGGSDGPADVRYEVLAPLQLASDGTVYACYAFLLTYPAEGCGGIRVRGVDFGQFSNIERYPSGAQVSPVMRLVGTWDRQRLTLTEAPQPAVTPPGAPGLPAPCEQDPNLDSGMGNGPLQRWMSGDPAVERRQGIYVLQAMPCDVRTIGFVVAVADDRTVRWLDAHYGPVKVAGWLQPLPSGP